MPSTSTASEIWIVPAGTDQVVWLAEQLPPHQDQQLYNTEGGNLSIELVRQLITNLSFPPLRAPQSHHVMLYADTASAPAQQALLKSLEEPPTYAHLILVVTQLEALLPTITSRCQVRTFTTSEESTAGDTTELQQHWAQLADTNFNYGQRVQLAEKFGDRAVAQTFLNHLSKYIHTVADYPQPQYVTALQTLTTGQEWLARNVSAKLAIEEVFFRLKP